MVKAATAVLAVISITSPALAGHINITASHPTIVMPHTTIPVTTIARGASHHGRQAPPQFLKITMKLVTVSN
jgi:hypothetical protein